MSFDKVKKLLAEQLNISVDAITLKSKVVEDLGADSLDIVELLMSFEDEFKVSIPDEKLEQLKTIPEIVAVIEEYSKK